MKHPKSENILKVIENFKKVLPMAKRGDHLDMTTPRVNCVGHICGTVHCHGGWFAIAACNMNQKLDFTNGANKMARMLCKRDADTLCNWAKKNPELWGNRYGDDMFSDSFAFTNPIKRPYGADNLQHIIDHWQEVYERVKALEEKLSSEKEVHECDATKPIRERDAWPNITSELAKFPVSETSDLIPETINQEFL